MTRRTTVPVLRVSREITANLKVNEFKPSLLLNNVIMSVFRLIQTKRFKVELKKKTI
jgi:hypothetical protein